MKNDMSILCPGSDDGAISWEEFVQFFADGVMGKEEMEKLFHDIDTHNTKQVILRDIHMENGDIFHFLQILLDLILFNTYR